MNALTFVLGGVRSGKSRFAQKIAARYREVLFVATARASDGEMREKIVRHREDRPPAWETQEETLDLADVLRRRLMPREAAVVDCLTLWVANLLDECDRERLKHLEGFYKELQKRRCALVVVSNEVGSGIVPAYRSGRLYRDLLGEVNQRVAELADDVFLMVAGIPLCVKSSGRA